MLASVASSGRDVSHEIATAPGPSLGFVARNTLRRVREGCGDSLLVDSGELAKCTAIN